MDGILVGGGNTLNMIAIWRAQEIIQILIKALDLGVILGGGSAGSLCWLEHGFTDSRPKQLTKIECLGFLDGSHSPHYYSDPDRRPLYMNAIEKGELKPGYAGDDEAGIYFEGQELKKVVSLNENSNVYYVLVENGVVTKKKLPKEVLT